jgi:acetyl-CoA acetyltransferase
MTPYGSFAGAGSVSLTMPEAVYMFLDKGERNKLLATLRNPAQGPNYVVGKANQAVREMRDMVRNYGLETGITIGMPGSTSWVNPSGGMTMSVAGIIATF